MDKHLVVTGGTKGIGRAICHRFAAHGFHISTCSRSQSDLDALKTEMQPYHVGVHTFKADLADRNQVDAFGDFVLGHWDHVDVLVNNTGIFIPGAVLQEEEGQLETMIHTNLYSAYYLCRNLVPSMVERQTGHIFNICSIASKIAYPDGGSYSISKFALLGLTKVLREETKGKKVKVTAVLPGATWSNSWAGVELPESRLMQADDIASAILNAYELSPSAVVEEIIIRPQLGDL
jgi:short-subunit dehydrogenase